MENDLGELDRESLSNRRTVTRPKVAKSVPVDHSDCAFYPVQFVARVQILPLLMVSENPAAEV
jgi:hypothetical protein